MDFDGANQDYAKVKTESMNNDEDLLLDNFYNKNQKNKQENKTQFNDKPVYHMDMALAVMPPAPATIPKQAADKQQQYISSQFT